MPLVRTLLCVVIGLLVVGISLYFIDAYVPMAGTIRGLLNFVVFVATCVGVLQAFGLWPSVVRVFNDLTHRRLVG